MIFEKIYDVVIIGSGPAGISCALSFINTNINVMIVESGNYSDNVLDPLKYRYSTYGKFDTNYYQMHSQRVFGGTSSVWSGYCTAMDRKQFIAGNWPINYQELERYYPSAATILDLHQDIYKFSECPISSDANLIYKPYYLSPPVRFEEKYANILKDAENINIITGYNCDKLIQKKNKIRSVQLTNSLDKTKKIEIRSENFVIACGGLGNPLLLSKSNIASESPVGRFLCEHPHYYEFSEILISKDIIDRVKSNTTDKNIVDAICLSDDFCEKNNLLSTTVRFETSKVEQKYYLGENLEFYRSKVDVVMEMNQYEKNYVKLIRNNKDSSYSINFNFLMGQTIRNNWLIFCKQMLKGGVGLGGALLPFEFPYFKLSGLFPYISRIDSHFIWGGGHFMCTTRMGTDKKDSVVDKNCKLYSLNNTFLAGSSVFSAPGAANPTFTIVTLAIRLGEYLKKKIENV